MHDDLLDAVDHLVGLGCVDRDRVGIYGGSYGGYAALVGAAFTPEVFRCAVDIVGPSNLMTLIASIPSTGSRRSRSSTRRSATPRPRRDLLWERSPLSRVDDIAIPLLVAQGANDPRVKQSEAEQIVEALVKKGIDHEYLLFEDEGHGLATPGEPRAFLRRRRALPGRAPRRPQRALGVGAGSRPLRPLITFTMLRDGSPGSCAW